MVSDVSRQLVDMAGLSSRTSATRVSLRDSCLLWVWLVYGNHDIFQSTSSVAALHRTTAARRPSLYVATASTTGVHTHHHTASSHPLNPVSAFPFANSWLAWRFSTATSGIWPACSDDSNLPYARVPSLRWEGGSTRLAHKM
jgi:hypothetical protein